MSERNLERDVTIDYTNWRGERRKRRITPIMIAWGRSRWHPEWQWVLIALDDGGVRKEFAMKGIHSWEYGWTKP